MANSHAPTDREVVLVVDDEPLIRMFTAETLRDAGFEVLEAGNSSEALDQAQSVEHRLGAIVSDIEMPGLNGCGLAWRARGVSPDVAVLLVSGATRPELQDLPAGSRFITKPFSLRNLLQELRKALAHERRGRDAAVHAGETGRAVITPASASQLAGWSHRAAAAGPASRRARG